MAVRVTGVSTRIGGIGGSQVTHQSHCSLPSSAIHISRRRCPGRGRRIFREECTAVAEIDHGCRVEPPSGCLPGAFRAGRDQFRIRLVTGSGRPNGVAEVAHTEPDICGCSTRLGGLPRVVTGAFHVPREAPPTCEYLPPLGRRSTFPSQLSSPEICPDLRKRHSEDAVSVLPWIATEGVPVT